MDNAVIASGGSDVTHDEEDGLSATQPRSSLGSTAASEDTKCNKDNSINSSPDVSSTEGSDDETVIITNESENNKDTTKIKGSCDIFKIVRMDINGGKEQMKEMEGTKLNIYVNTSANTAMFMLSGYITLKGSRRKSNKQQVYLRIPPERIDSITTKISPNRRSTASKPAMPNDCALHFSLTHGPDFIGPQDRHIVSKRGTQQLLAFIQDLVMATELTFHLGSSDRGEDFERLATIFSRENKKNRPQEDNQYGNLATLYAGKGGMVINVNESLAHAEASPPPYPGAVLRSPLAKKRRLTSYESRRTSNERRRPNFDVDDHPGMLSLLCSVQTGLDDLCARLDDIEHQSKTRHNDLHTRLNDIENQSKTRHDNIKFLLETRLNDIENQSKSRFDILEESLGQAKNTQENLDAVYTPCRYDSAERDYIFQEAVKRCEEHLDVFELRSYEANEELEKERDAGVTTIREEVEGAKANLHDTVKCFREVLQDASKALKKFS